MHLPLGIASLDLEVLLEILGPRQVAGELEAVVDVLLGLSSSLSRSVTVPSSFILLLVVVEITR